VARVLIAQAASRPLRILCARETQKSIQESVHRLLKDQIGMLGLESLFEVQENKILGRNGSEITFVGIRQQGVANLKSYEGTDICWVEEAQVVSKKSWDVLIPTIRKPGSEIWITFNPELDTDETYHRFVAQPPEDGWVCQVNWSDNPWFPVELERERSEWQRRDPEGYKTVWEGQCRPSVEGAIYSAEINALIETKRIRDVPVDPSLRVHTVWDLGFNDSMAIIFVQKLASELRVVDFIEDSHRTLDSYVQEIKSRPWNWGVDYLPHDAANRDFKYGKSTEEMLRSMGRDPYVLGRGDPEQGIIRARMVFPMCFFDRDKTSVLVNHLKRYRRSVNQATGEPGPPLHDEHSHAADAFRYLASAADLMTNESWSKLPETNTNWIV
jgi:phage terminase large subunit